MPNENEPPEEAQRPHLRLIKSEEHESAFRSRPEESLEDELLIFSDRIHKYSRNPKRYLSIDRHTIEEFYDDKIQILRQRASLEKRDISKELGHIEKMWQETLAKADEPAWHTRAINSFLDKLPFFQKR